MSLFDEFKRRNVIRVGAAYAVGAWLLIQVIETIFPLFGFDETPARIVVIVLAVGFIPALVISWAFELTPEGLKRDRDVDPEHSIALQTGKKLDRIIMVVLALALGYFALDRFVFAPEREASVAEEARQEGRTEALVESYGDQSIAVLQFTDMSLDGDQEYLSDGIAEELLNLLAKVPELRVISRTSSFAFKGQALQVPEIARRLKVGFVLEGSVRKAGSQIRITAQLIEARSDTHLWSSTYDRALDDIFAIQDEIAAAVVESLKIVLLGPVPLAKVVDSASLELTLRGRFLFNRRNEGDLQKALELYERAVELDPDNADAWVGLVPLYLWSIDPPDLTRARSAAELALTLDPTNSNAHFRLASVLYHEGKREESMQSAYKALELDPNNAVVLAALGGEAVAQGDLELAIEYGRRAIALDPLYITGLQNHAYNLTLVGRLDQAEEIAHRILEIAPENPGGNSTMARILLLKGHMDEALEIASRLSNSQTSNPGVDENLLLTAMAYYSLGNHEASDAILKSFQIQYADSQPIQMAYLHAWRGEIDEAFEWIDQAFAQEPGISVEAFLDPFLSRLHADPRWTAVMAHWNTADQ